MTIKKVLVSFNVDTVNTLDSLLERTHTPRSDYLEDLVKSQFQKLAEMPRMIE